MQKEIKFYSNKRYIVIAKNVTVEGFVIQTGLIGDEEHAIEIYFTEEEFIDILLDITKVFSGEE